MFYFIFIWAPTAFITLMLIITTYNFFTIRRPRQSDKSISQKVSILIPMRNEQHNAQDSVSSALSQKLLPKLEIIIRDDQSTDKTLSILQQFSDDRLSVQTGNLLPSGWLGKPYAMAELANAAQGEYLIFLDADVRLTPNAVADSISLLEELNLDYLSPYPRQLVGDWLSGLVQPLLQWSWFSTLPIRGNERSLRRSTVVANGQFFIVRRSAYFAVAGHSSIRSEVIDDLELARLLRRNGYRGSVVDGSSIATCLMYENFNQLLEGYLKSQWRAFGSISGAIFAILFLTLTSIAPAVLAMSGNIWAAVATFGIIITRLLAAWKTRSIAWSSFLHPLSISIWIFIIISSLVLKQRGKLFWRGRPI